MATKKKALQAAAGAAAGGGFTAIEDVFSTYLYTGTGGDGNTTQTVSNGVDLAGEGGLVWIQERNDSSNSYSYLADSDRGSTKYLTTQVANAEGTQADAITSFNSDGFTLGLDSVGRVNYATGSPVTGRLYASWTFRKAPRFFDVVTYTGTGANRTVSHDLGTTVGSIIIKRTDTTSNWAVYHRGNTASPETDYLSLNLTSATADDATFWNDTAPTDSVFTVGTNAAVNASGGTYVAYLYAHDPLGPSGDGSDGLIACGSYTGTGAAGNQITLGWEPQWLLVKNASTGGQNWEMFDNMRGVATGGIAAELFPNTSDAERAAFNIFNFNATGFATESTLDETNASGDNYIYIAIRRGPMRVPESGTEVFAIDTFENGPPAYTSGFPVDWGFRKTTNSTTAWLQSTRLTGATQMSFDSTAAETASTNSTFDFMEGWFNSASSIPTNYCWMFRRAPNFFDVVAYTGTGANLTLPHNLTTAPELVIAKVRNTGSSWGVSTSNDWSKYLLLNSANAQATASLFGTPDATNFYPTASGGFSGSGNTYIAYLFATLAGVSKVGSYTGNGSNQTINCGFTSGARFILIKRTDSTGDWYVWDTARGIVTGNDPHLSLNTTAAEVTSDDSIDPASSGFIVNQVAATNINVSSASYIFYAVS